MLQTPQKRRRNGLGLCIDIQGSVSFRLNKQSGSSQCQSFLSPPKKGAAHNIHLCLLWCFAENFRWKWMFHLHNSARMLVLLVMAVSWGLLSVLQGLCFNEVTWHILALRILRLLETEVYTLNHWSGYAFACVTWFRNFYRACLTYGGDTNSLSKKINPVWFSTTQENKKQCQSKYMVIRTLENIWDSKEKQSLLFGARRDHCVATKLMLLNSQLSKRHEAMFGRIPKNF